MSGYKVKKLLGVGSFGKAYLCQNKTNNSLCVIKQIVMEGLSEKEKNETLNEVSILKQLDHPNIIKFQNVFTQNKPKITLNIVTEYADGGDLSQKIKAQKQKKTPFLEKEIIDYITQICLALQHIHKKKIIHRDIKSGNIFLMKSGLIKLGDFGIAKGFLNTYEKAKTVVGTPYYLSPEIIQSKPYDSKSDVWALGVLLYELMTFKMPFQAQSLPLLSIKIVRGIYHPPPPSFSQDIRDLLKMCFIVDPEKRPSIDDILHLPFITKRIFSYLDEVKYNKDLSVTIIQKYKENKANKKKKQIKKVNVDKYNKDKNKIDKQGPSSCSNMKKILNSEKDVKKGVNDKNVVKNFFKKKAAQSNKSIPDVNIEKKFGIEDSKQIKKEQNDEKEKKEEKDEKEPINFLKPKILVPNVKINDSKNSKGNESNPSQKNDLRFNAQNMYSGEDYLKTMDKNGLNELINDYSEEKIDVNNFNEDQFNQIRLLHNLSKIANGEKQLSDDEDEPDNKINVINSVESKNSENNVILDEINANVESVPDVKNLVDDKNCIDEYKEIDNLKKEIENEIGSDLFKKVYGYVEKYSDKTEIKCDNDLVKEKILKELKNNKKINQKKLKIAVDKIPEIFAIVMKENLIKK